MKCAFASVGCVALVCVVASLSEVTAEALAGARNSKEAHFSSAVFEFDRGGVLATHWSLELRADGSGNWTSLSGPAGAPSAPLSVRIDETTESKLSAAVPIVQSGKCETKLKNIAKTGSKTLTYTGVGEKSPATCTFNYSDSETLNSLADSLLAVTSTLEAGERIAHKHRYDRLGLDAELDTLIAETKSGRALMIANIAPVLASVASDERVMERVQRKAARLLQEAGVTSADSAR